MQENEHLSPAENELEAALAGLHPARCPIDRDRLMFLAGHASARRTARPWRIATAGLALAASVAIVAAIAARPWAQRAVSPAERIVIVRANETKAPPVPSPAQPPPRLRNPLVALSGPIFPPGPDGLAYLHLRDAVLARGLDALPAAAHPGSGTPVWQERKGPRGLQGQQGPPVTPDKDHAEI